MSVIVDCIADVPVLHIEGQLWGMHRFKGDELYRELIQRHQQARDNTK
jgi:hypothetical protein